MITILAVAGRVGELAPALLRHPSIEVLTASGVEDALEKLARNRRIDAVLLLGTDALEVASAIGQEDPAAPPLFAPASAGAIPGVRSLPDRDPAALAEEIVALLEP